MQIKVENEASSFEMSQSTTSKVLNELTNVKLSIYVQSENVYFHMVW